MTEPLLAAALVATETALAAALAWGAARPRAPRLAWPLAMSLALGLLVGLGTAFFQLSRGASDADLTLPMLRLRQLQVLGLLAAAFLLRRPAPAGSPGAPRPLREVLEFGTLLAGLSWAIPTGAGLAIVLRDQTVLAGAPWPVAALAAGGLLAGVAAGLLTGWVLTATRAGAALPPSAAAALLAALLLAGPGAAAARLPAVAQGLTGAVARIIHDGLHVTFVGLELPDHPFLQDRVYQLILALLEPLPHAVATALIFGLPAVACWRAFARRPGEASPPDQRTPARRLARAAFRRTSRIAGAAFALALAVTLASVVSAQVRSESLYDPIPEPVVDDGAGNVIVPLGGPLGGTDGRLRKFAWSFSGRTIVFFTVARGNGSLAVALDLCEICQPKGYAQLGGKYVFCKYCKTPIPVDTLGQPGGCNPIPLPSAAVQGGVLRVPTAELRALHEKALAGLK